jgi:murein DD-endopeptidase MepM/ murein hydrolase activator NlpD
MFSSADAHGLRWAVALILCGLACWASGGRAAPPPAEPARTGTWQWPLDGAPRVVRRFDPPADPYGAGHRGVDLAAAPGALVRSSGAGVIWFAGPVGGRGVVSVQHAGGLRTTYEPVRTTGLRTGTPVRPGTPLGRLAAKHPGCRAVACLHWGLIAKVPGVGAEYRDPTSLLGPGRVRLYPVTGVSR